MGSLSMTGAASGSFIPGPGTAVGFCAGCLVSIGLHLIKHKREKRMKMETLQERLAQQHSAMMEQVKNDHNTYEAVTRVEIFSDFDRHYKDIQEVLNACAQHDKFQSKTVEDLKNKLDLYTDYVAQLELMKRKHRD